jgi:ABC-type antimicrobial peptide transport system permease subunit
VVNQAFSRRFLDGANPLRHTVASRLPGLGRRPIEIVGLAHDAVYGAPRAEVEPIIYLPLSQADWLPAPYLASLNVSVRPRTGSPTLLTKRVAEVVSGINHNFVFTSRLLAEQVDAALVPERVVATLSGLFGAVALLLAALGVYGVTSYAVARQRREIGVRIALGAGASGIVALVLSRISMLIGLGIVVGTGISLWASKFVASLLFGLGPRDPATLVGAIVILTSVGVFAAWFPAHRASRLDPARVLRDG